MKPSFALNLTEVGITLLHRTSRGWMDVGTVAFDDPDMGAALDYLRSTALGLSPKGLATKLIIPESQILYLQVEAAGPDDTSRRAQIDIALDGRTPYALDELVYDWTADGSRVTVAVVARETLAEAEAFANEHRFNPVSFVARPENGFGKEPFFGTSAMAAGFLPDGESVETDDQPVTIIAREASLSEAADSPPAPTATVEADAPNDVTDAGPPDLPSDAPEVTPAPAEQSAPDLPEATPPEQALSEPTPMEPPAQARLFAETEPPVPMTPAPEPAVEPPAAVDELVEEPAKPSPVDQRWAEPVASAAEQPTEKVAEEVAAPVPDLSASNLPPSPVADLDLPDPAPVPEAPVQPEPQRPEPLTRSAAVPPQRVEPSFAPVTRKAAPVALPALDEPEAPMAVDVPQDDSGEAAAPVSQAQGASVVSEKTPVEDDLPPPPSAASMMAFSSRRPLEGAPRPLGSVVPGAETGAARPAAPSALRPMVAKPVVDRPAAARPAPKFSYDDPAPPPTRLPGDPPGPPASAASKTSKGLRGLGSLVTASSIPGTRKKKPAPTASAPQPPAAIKPTPAPAAPAALGATLAAPLEASPIKASASAAAQSLSRQKAVSPDAIAKGLSARAMPQRGKPKYLGLILTGLLLLLLAIVAAWSSFYLTRLDEPSSEVQVAGFDSAIDPEALADGQGTDLDAALQESDDLAVDVDLTDLAVDQPAEAPVAELAATEADLPPPAATVAEPAPATGVQDVITEANQPDPANQDEIFLAAMDAPPSLSDPLVLTPPAAQGDAPPGDQMPPPPFGTVYQFDANGRIVPTAEGILTPEGVWLVAGPPALVPPPRPAALEAAATAVPPATAETVADATAPAAVAGEVQPAATFAADPSLAAARPRLRPEGLVPAPAETTEDDASLAPAQDSRFASLRPRVRPVTILAAGEASRQASEAASLAVQAAVAEANDANISPQAVAVSRVPAPRPRDLSRAVEAAVAAATRRADPAPAAAAVASASTAAPSADEADDEPEVASAAPRIPTRANVAKQATFVNAINLGKINLIGVYGTQSKRYALVRQANGRFRKVSVGDNLDGGRVQAITASEVRYQKGGRMLALAMPNG